MNNKRLLAILAAMIGAILAGTLALPAGAQDPVVSAAATIQAATDQARAAMATRAAVEVEATSQALDDLASQRAAAATSTAQAQSAAATVTAGAYQTTATGAAVQAGATATSQAQDAAATSTAYSLAYQQSKEQADLGRNLLYLAAALALGGCAYVVMTWARAAARRLDPSPAGRAFDPGPVRWEPAGAGGVVVDVTPSNLPALPGPSVRMPDQVRIVNDPDLSAKIEKWFYGGSDAN